MDRLYEPVREEGCLWVGWDWRLELERFEGEIGIGMGWDDSDAGSGDARKNWDVLIACAYQLIG